MFRVLPLLLMIGLIALAPLAVPAQDKDNKVDEKKVDEKVDEKKVDEKKVDDPVKAEPPVTPATKAEEKKGTPALVYKELDYAEKANQILPFISLILIAVLFVLLLSLRSTVSQLEEKIKGGS